MYGKKSAHNPFPATRSQYFSEHGKAGQQEILDVVVNQPCIYPHMRCFNTARTGIRLRVADMCGERVLEALKFRERRGHGSHPHAESE